MQAVRVTEQRLIDHVDEAVVALAQTLLKQPRAGQPASTRVAAAGCFEAGTTPA